MNEWPLPNSILVVDNASIHKVASIREMVEECGARLVYLPVYSLDFNPIELAF
jgi:transposase